MTERKNVTERMEHDREDKAQQRGAERMNDNREDKAQ